MNRSELGVEELEARLASKKVECNNLVALIANQRFEIEQLRIGIEALSKKNEELFLEKRQREENIFNS